DDPGTTGTEQELHVGDLRLGHAANAGQGERQRILDQRERRGVETATGAGPGGCGEGAVRGVVRHGPVVHATCAKGNRPGSEGTVKAGGCDTVLTDWCRSQDVRPGAVHGI